MIKVHPLNTQADRVRALRTTMIEARHIARAAKRDYVFARRANDRIVNLLAWAVAHDFSVTDVGDKWIVVQFADVVQPDATIQEALLRAYELWDSTRREVEQRWNGSRRDVERRVQNYADRKAAELDSTVRSVGVASEHGSQSVQRVGQVGEH